MHTDEYEISITREINHCQRVVKKTQEKLTRFERLYGLTYPVAAAAVMEGLLTINARELGEWQEEYEALPVWEQRLAEYRQALTVMRISASGS